MTGGYCIRLSQHRCHCGSPGCSSKQQVGATMGALDLISSIRWLSPSWVRMAQMVWMWQESPAAWSSVARLFLNWDQSAVRCLPAFRAEAMVTSGRKPEGAWAHKPTSQSASPSLRWFTLLFCASSVSAMPPLLHFYNKILFYFTFNCGYNHLALRLVS